MNAEGRPAGEAFVEFVNEDSARGALANYNGKMMGSRYVELFEADRRYGFLLTELFVFGPLTGMHIGISPRPWQFSRL